MTEGHSKSSRKTYSSPNLVDAEAERVDELLDQILPEGWFWVWDKYGQLRLLTDAAIVRNAPPWE